MMFSRHEIKKAESEPRRKPFSKHGSSESITAQVGKRSYHTNKSETDGLGYYAREGQRRERPQSLTIPYIVQDDGFNPPRILFVSPPTPNRTARGVDASVQDSKRRSEHSDRRGSVFSRWLKEDLEDAIRLALSKVEIQLDSTSVTMGTGHVSEAIDPRDDHEEGYRPASRQGSDSHSSYGDRSTSHGNVHQKHQQQGHRAEVTSRSFPHPAPHSFYYHHRQPFQSPGETLYDPGTNCPTYADASAQTEEPNQKRHDAEPDQISTKTTSRRLSHILYSRPPVPHVNSSESHVVDEDMRVRTSGQCQSRKSSGSHASYPPPYRVLVTPGDEDRIGLGKVSYKYDTYVCGKDDRDERRGRVVECNGEMHRRHRKPRCRHTCANYYHENGIKERREDGDRDRERRRSSRHGGDGSGRWHFPFIKDRRSEYQ